MSLVPVVPVAIGAPRGKSASDPLSGEPRVLSAGSRMSLLDTAPPSLAEESFVPGEVVVKFRGGDVLTAGAKKAVHAKAGGKRGKRLGRTPGLELVTLEPGISVEDAIADYGNQGVIEYAEPNYRYRIAAGEIDVGEVQVMTDDPLLPDLWGLHNTGQTGGVYDADIDAPAAWNLTTGSDDVVVAVVDTGVDYGHPDLDGNMWTNALEETGVAGIDDDGNGYVDDVHGYDFLNSDSDPMDDHGHGTHVSGTIAAEGQNGIGVVGVVWDASIMGLKTFDSQGYGDLAAEIEAITYADMMGADVINCSWGGGPYSQALRDAMDDADAVVVCAAGNSHTNDDVSPYYPATYDVDNIVAVAATDHNDKLADFSNYGATTVDLAAPGKSILSAKPGTQGAIWEDDISTLDAWDVSTYSVAPWIRDTDPENYYSAPSALTHLSPSDNEDAWAITGPFDFSGGTSYILWANYYWNLESNFDYLYVDVSTDGAAWTTYASLTGSRQGYLYADLSSWAGNPEVWVRYRLVTDDDIQSDGVIIDDLRIESDVAPAEYGYQYMSGTSMATPHVSGAAALLKAYDPALTPVEIKDILLASVDPLAVLDGVVVSGGRLNVDSAAHAAAGVEPSVNKVERVYAGTRYTTAVAIARMGFDADEDSANGTQWGGVTHIVIASGEDRAAADPLAAAGLCGLYDAPLFLVKRTAVSAEVKLAIKEIVQASVDPVTIHIVGGPMSVPSARVTEITRYVGAGGSLISERVLSKGDRYDLAAAIAMRMADVLGDRDTVLVANGADSATFFDAAALSPIAAAQGYPILLVRGNEIPSSTIQALKNVRGAAEVEIIVGGGPNTVSNAVVDSFGLHGYTERWYGSTRYTTAITVANKAIERGWLSEDFVGVAAKLPDALTGGSVVGRRGGALVLTASATLSPETGSWLSTHRSGVNACGVFGGPNSVSRKGLDAIKAKVN